MPLEKNVQTIGFSSSVKEQVDPQLVPNGSLRGIENGVFDKDGRIRKRYGFTALTQNTISGQPLYSSQWFTAASKLWGHGDELVVWDEKRAFGYSPTTDLWALKCEHGSVSGERLGLAKDMGHLVQGADVAVTTTGIRCVAFIQRAASNALSLTYLYSSIYDEATGAVIAMHKRIDGDDDCSAVRLIVVNTGTDEFFVVVYRRYDGGNYELYTSYLDSADPSAGWSVPVHLGRMTRGTFDAVALTGDVFAVACYNNDGADKIYLGVYTHDTAGTPGFTWTATWSIAAGAANYVALDWDGDPAAPAAGDRIHLAYYDDTVLKWRSFSSTLTADQSATVDAAVDFGGSITYARCAVKHLKSEGKALVLWHANPATGQPAPVVQDPVILLARWVTSASGALLGSGPLQTAHTMLTSRPFQVGTMAHVMTSGAMWMYNLSATYGFNTFATEGLFLLRYDATLAAETQLAPRVVTQLALDEGIGMPVTYTAQARQVAEYGGKYYVAQALAASNFGGSYADFNVDQEIFRLDPLSKTRCKALHVGTNTLLLGGSPAQYDGDTVSELSFPYGPVIVEMDEAAGAGSLTKAGNGLYTYKMTFEWFNAAGDRVFSETSLSAQITLSATLKNVEIYYRGMPISSKSDWFPSSLVQVYACVYRTLEDDDQTFYLVAREPLNRFATDIYNFTDTTADPSSNEQLYTNGIELDATALPSCSVGAVADGLVWMRSDEFKSRLYYSKPLVPGRPVEFNNEFSSITLPFDVYGLAAQQGACVAVGEHSVGVIEGRGPGLTGQGDSFQQRTMLTGVGSTQPMSVVETPVGTLFFSGKTWCLINGKFGLEILGDVDDTMSDFPVIVDVARTDSDGTFRFLCHNTAGDDFVVVTFDWQSRNWSVHTPTFMSDVATTELADSIAQVGGEVYVGAGATVYQESGWSDSGVYNQEVEPTLGQVAFFPLIIETADLKTGNLDDFKRIWRVILLLRRMGAHGIRLSAAYNGDPTYTVIREWTTAEITAVGATERLRHHMARQKCSTVRYKIEDTDPGTGSGSRGYEALGLTLELGIKKGTLKFQKESV